MTNNRAADELFLAGDRQRPTAQKHYYCTCPIIWREERRFLWSFLWYRMISHGTAGRLAGLLRYWPTTAGSNESALSQSRRRISHVMSAGLTPCSAGYISSFDWRDHSDAGSEGSRKDEGRGKGETGLAHA